MGRKKFYPLNDRIRADELRVVDDSGKQLGVMSKEDALAKAKEDGVDVVLVAPRAKPPVAKLIEFDKFKYQQQQKEAQSRKKSKSVELKEIRLSPFIAKGDLDVRMKKAREFLEDGNKVRLNVKFVGRQITRKEFGYELLDKMIEQLSDVSDVEMQPKMQGRVLTAQLQAK